MRIKRTTKIVAVVAVLGIVAAILVLNNYGLIPGFPTGSLLNQEEETPCCADSLSGATNLGLTKMEIFSSLEILCGKDLNYVEISAYIDALHMKAWGLNGATANSVLLTYESKYAGEGWNAHGRVPRGSGDWIAWMESWIDNTDGRLVIAGEGAAVTAAFGYDVVVLTAYGPLTTFWQFYNSL